MSSISRQFAETTRAFDLHAREYDARVENNALLQTMRAALWAQVTRVAPAGARLLDLGCGTGIDAVYFAQRGYQMVAIDSSREMVERARSRSAAAKVTPRVRVENIGIHELKKLEGEEFDGIYSNLGPLNCVADLQTVSANCAALLKPTGVLIVSVMGRHCPWELAYYALRGNWKRARLRYTNAAVAVKLETETVLTRYYTPREFYAGFADHFQLVAYRALNLFLPPPYLIRWYQRARPFFTPLAWLDHHLGSLPFLREAGDHFLMTLKLKR